VTALDRISDRDYRSLAEFRHQIRRFLHFSEQVVRSAGIEPQQHQLLLALRSQPDGQAAIGALAERLQIQHHSAVELVNRLETGGFVQRERGSQDRREVLLQLTPRGEKVLRELSLHHRSELRSQGPALLESLQQLISETRNVALKKRK